MANSVNINIALRGKSKGTVKQMSLRAFNEMVLSNLEASFELEGVKRTSRNRDKIRNASKLLEGII
ncbi:hypothetical protein [Aliivibrio sp. S10_S31]|uniref:hypothetical protein n=1 Tax=Aliivibrio sp. S10_S31 TaxID=2720224 RepID=UPI0016813114|nr:hypothetical protein [Aliivibrio sp. S10_S31]MBD1571534.1 hypothetical protein [Aliivibrio sp. S10_S31]